MVVHNANVSEPDIKVMSRWSTVENAQGSCPQFSMLEHYSDVLLMLPTMLRFSEAL